MFSLPVVGVRRRSTVRRVGSRGRLVGLLRGLGALASAEAGGAARRAEGRAASRIPFRCFSCVLECSLSYVGACSVCCTLGDSCLAIRDHTVQCVRLLGHLCPMRRTLRCVAAAGCTAHGATRCLCPTRCFFTARGTPCCSLRPTGCKDSLT